MSNGPYTRVNGELIKPFKGKSVSLLGKLKKVKNKNRFDLFGSLLLLIS
jgi:hypothetical protein